MIVTYIVAAVFCWGFVKATICPNGGHGADCALPNGDPNAQCSAGACSVYLNYGVNQCGLQNTGLRLAHPTDFTKYCQCNHQGTSAPICEMECAEGTHFDGKLQSCIHGECAAPCDANPCISAWSCQSYGNSYSPLPWTCNCKHGCGGWNCQFTPCYAEPCPAGQICLNEPRWFPLPVQYYTCKNNPCSSNPCPTGKNCVATADFQSYVCNIIPVDGSCDDTCAGVSNVNRQHPSQCNKYCACGYGTANEMPCPAGTYFSVATCGCTDRSCNQGHGVNA